MTHPALDHPDIPPYYAAYLLAHGRPVNADGMEADDPPTIDHTPPCRWRVHYACSDCGDEWSEVWDDEPDACPCPCDRCGGRAPVIHAEMLDEDDGEPIAADDPSTVDHAGLNGGEG